VELKANEINRFFEMLEEVHNEKERYSIEWAFEDAQKKIDFFKRDMIDVKLKSKCRLCPGNDDVQEGFDGLQKASKGIIRRSRWYRRIFSNMYTVLSFVEILISFLLVMGLSELSHSGAAFIDSHMFSLIFAGIFAFLKVIIERYWVSPALEKWGWILYQRTVIKLKDMTLALNYEATINRASQENTFDYFAESFQMRSDSQEDVRILA